MTTRHDMSQPPSPRSFIVGGCRCDECKDLWARYKAGEIPYDETFKSHLSQDYFQAMVRIDYEINLRERAEKSLEKQQAVTDAVEYCRMNLV